MHCTFILVLHDSLLFNQLHVALVGQFELLQVLVDFPQLISILLEPALQLMVDILLPPLLLLLLQLADSLDHSLPDLLGSLLHIDDLFLVKSVLIGQQLGELLSK